MLWDVLRRHWKLIVHSNFGYRRIFGSPGRKKEVRYGNQIYHSGWAYEEYPGIDRKKKYPVQPGVFKGINGLV